MPQYLIKYGDTLYSIARRFGITLEQLLAANPQIINPDMIYPGANIVIPSPTPAPGQMIYIVQRGDSLYSIARRFGTTVDTLLRLNPNIKNASLIYPGQQVNVPLPAPVTAPGCIIYVSTRTGKAEIWRSYAMGANPISLTGRSGETEQLYVSSSPQWSPDGRSIAFISMADQIRVLNVMGPCGENKTVVARQDVGSFSWSPDSTMIAFSNVQGTFVVTPGGEPRKVSDRLNGPQWYPDGKTLVGNTSIEDINFAVLATVDITGENFKPLVDPLIPGGLIRLSPDGRYAAIQLYSGSAYSFVSQVSVYDFLTGSLVRLSGTEFETEPGITRDISSLGGWSPDSTMLSYSTLVNPQGYSEIKIASPVGAILQSYGRGFYANTGWGPTPDWIIITLSEQPGTNVFEATAPQNIYVLNIRTDRQFKITSTGSNAFPDWVGTPCQTCF